MNIASSFRFFAKQVIQQSFFAAWLGFFILLISGTRINAQSPGNCINFDGVNDYITTSNSITSPTSFTIECWVRSDEFGNSTNSLLDRTLVSFNQTSPANELFNVRMGKTFYWCSSNNPYFNLNQGFQNAQLNNKWHHVAVTSSSSTGTKIYIDGYVMDSTASYPNLSGKTGKWVIGILGSTSYNKGSMDELRIWNTVRTKEQIQANMYSELNGTANSGSLYLYYKFNENSGTSVNDWSNNNNTGTLKNFALSGSTSNWIESYAGVVPTNVTVSNINYNSATISWTPSTIGSVDNYYVEYGYNSNNSGNTISKINVGNVTSYTLTGLSQNTKYFFRVRANKTSVEDQGGYREDFYPPGGFTIRTFCSYFITSIQPIVVNCTNNPVTAYADGITTTVIDSNMTFTKNAGVYHYKFKVFFVSGKQYGDSLYYRSSLPSGITAAYDTASGILTFTASTQNVAASVWQGVLRNVTFKAYKKGNNTRKIAYAFGDYTYGPNAHFYIPYLCSPSCSKTWTNAKDAGFLAYGCTGYLATITSQAENDTIKSLTAGNNIWIGLSDDYAQINAATGTTTYANQAASEGKFYWVTGPEKGTQITSTNSPVTTISGKYNNWRSGEPSNSGGTEHATEFFGSDGTWNDADGIASKFYILEFGGMQGDAANVLVDTVTINIATASEPANSLNFDGTNDYVAIPDNDSLDLTNNYTIEAWIKPNNFTFIGGIVSKYHTSASSGFILRLTPGAPYSGITFDELVTANGVLTQGKWQHVAAVKNGSNRYVYINGQQIGLTGTPLTTANNTDSVMIGVDFATSPRYFDGNIDEVRIWRTARSQDSIIANMNKPISPASTSLVAYYNMNQGVAGGNNAGLNSLYDQTNNNFTGTVRNVANSGSTSNWVESYAMVVPVTTAATNKYSLGFVANWTTPVTGISQKYYLDLSTASDFSSFVSGYNNLDVSNVNSYTISGLTASTTYYYRVRAEKSGTGVTTTGGYSNTTTVTTDVTETLVATEAANRTSISFTAKWSAPQLGTISSYTLDVSTNNTFTAPISGSPFTVADTSKNITGLISNTTYYYRVRATNYNNSNTITTTTNAPFASISSSLSSICLNGTTPVITFTGSGSTSLPYTFTYTINGGSNQTITTIGGDSTVTLNVPVNTAGTYVYALVRVEDASTGNNIETSSTTVTVNDKPTPTFISAPAANTCSGIDVSYTTESGQTNYTWNVPGTLGTDYTITSGGIDTSSNTVTLKWLTAGSKTVTVDYQNASGCTAATVSSNTTTVGITPSNTPITGTTSTTVGLSSQLSNTTLNGVWSSSDMSVAFVNASGRVIGSSEGTSTIYYTVTSGACSNVASTLFTVNAAPVVSITSFTPTTSIPGNTMTVTGTGFLGTSSIYVGEYFVDNYTVNSDTTITLTIPEGTGSNLKLFVTAPGGIDSTSGANLFTYFSVPAPTITSFTPTSAGYHYTVVITGTNFLNAQQVTFGDVVVYSYTVNSDTQITAVIDTGSTGSVSVTTAGGTATASGFTFLPCSGQPLVNAGAAMSACNNVSANIASTSTASNYASLVWSTTDGTGSFDNNTTATALSTTTYTPSAADLSRGYVTLKLMANPNTGCLADSSTKVLTYKYTSSSSTSATACTSYTWNGTTYTTSGVKTYTTTNAVGCDSVVTLTLTINDASTYTQTVSACNSYTWHDSTYTSSTNTPTWTTTNAVGCDSVVTLHLTINTGTFNSETQTACDTYTWNGTAYTSSGVYTYNYTNGDGCASVDTLHLTITSSTSNTNIIAACTEYLWSANGQTYTTSGSYTVVTNCATEILDLTITPAVTKDTTVTACGSYTINGSTYTSSGDYTQQLTASNNCDSLLVLHLTINSLPTNPGPINGVTEVCALIGSSTPTIYSVSPVASAASYTWTVPTGATIVSGAGTNSIGVTFTNALAYTNQRISVVSIATQGCQSVTTSTITLTKTVPAMPTITGPVNVCPYIGAGNANYTCDSIANVTSYLWTVPNGASIVSGQGTRSIQVSFTSTFTVGFVGVTAMSNCGNRAQRTLSLTKLTPGVPAAITGPTSACSYLGTNQEVTYSIASVNNASSYTWTVPATVTIVSGQGTTSIVVRFAANYVSSNFKVKSVSNCYTSSDRQLLVTGATYAAPGVISGPTNACFYINSDTSATYTIRKVANAPSYIWTVPTGATIVSHPGGLGVNDTSIVVSYTNSFVSGTRILLQTTGCGTSTATGLTINATISNMPNVISGPTNACQYMASANTPNGSLATYMIRKVSGANFYTWIAPANATIMSHPAGTGVNDTVVQVKFADAFVSGGLSVKSGNSCGTSANRTLTIAKLNAATPSNIDVQMLSDCPSRVYKYTIASMPLQATSLVWTIPQGATIVSGQGTTSITVSYPSTIASGFVTVQGFNNCSIGAIRSIIIKLQSCPGALIATPSSKTTEQVSEGLKVSVYPNPTTNLFNLKVASSSNNTLVKARLLDLQGRPIKTMMIKPNETIPMGSDLKSGVYILEVNQGGELKTVRVVKY